MSWYQDSYVRIAEMRRQNPEMTVEEQRKYCSKNYPYGPRSGWPYKAWLSAMRDHFGKTQKTNTPQHAMRLDK
jgi:hypothetical protein